MPKGSKQGAFITQKSVFTKSDKYALVGLAILFLAFGFGYPLARLRPRSACLCFTKNCVYL
jgi:hypothetical protein